MSKEEFDRVLEWLKAERAEYQPNKFDYEAEKDKPAEYWMQQFNSYLQRIPLFGLDTQQGFQATLKLAATAVALAEHYGGKMEFPAPGVSSGEISDWIE